MASDFGTVTKMNLATLLVSMFLFLLVADVPHLSLPVVFSVRSLAHQSTWWWNESLQSVLGTRLGEREVGLYLDAFMGLLGALVLGVLLLFREWSISPTPAAVVGSSELVAVPGGQQPLVPSNRQPPDHQKRKRMSSSDRFIDQVWSLCVFGFWVSLSRLDKKDPTSENLYLLVNATMVLLALLVRKTVMLLGVLGLGWYQGHRAVDVFSRSRLYAKALLAYDDTCVLIRCVNPMTCRAR